jgi:ketosteroid isomerase-like protein
MLRGGELALQSFDAWRRGDREWVVQHSSADVVIAQPPEFPDSRTYRGHQGLLDAFDDWPRQWESFDVSSVELIDDVDDAAILFTKQHVVARGGIAFDLDVYNVFSYQDDLATSWEMFTSLDEARLRLRDLVAP